MSLLLILVIIVVGSKPHSPNHLAKKLKQIMSMNVVTIASLWFCTGQGPNATQCYPVPPYGSTLSPLRARVKAIISYCQARKKTHIRSESKGLGNGRGCIFSIQQIIDVLSVFVWPFPLGKTSTSLSRSTMWRLTMMLSSKTTWMKQ